MWSGITSFDILGNKMHCKYLYKPDLSHLYTFSAHWRSRAMSCHRWQLCIALSFQRRFASSCEVDWVVGVRLGRCFALPATLGACSESGTCQGQASVEAWVWLTWFPIQRFFPVSLLPHCHWSMRPVVESPLGLCLVTQVYPTACVFSVFVCFDQLHHLWDTLGWASCSKN